MNKILSIIGCGFLIASLMLAAFGLEWLALAAFGAFGVCASIVLLRKTS